MTLDDDSIGEGSRSSRPGLLPEARSAWPRCAYKPLWRFVEPVRFQGSSRVLSSATNAFKAAWKTPRWSGVERASGLDDEPRHKTRKVSPASPAQSTMWWFAGISCGRYSILLSSADGRVSTATTNTARGSTA